MHIFGVPAAPAASDHAPESRYAARQRKRRKRRALLPAATRALEAHRIRSPGASTAARAPPTSARPSCTSASRRTRRCASEATPPELPQPDDDSAGAKKKKRATPKLSPSTWKLTLKWLPADGEAPSPVAGWVVQCLRGSALPADPPPKAAQRAAQRHADMFPSCFLNCPDYNSRNT